MNDTAKTNLSDLIEEQLSAAVVDFIHGAGELAEKAHQRLYLVGGVVRDILLDRVNLDFDLVIEGDALVFAEKLAKTNKATFLTHPRFGTAALKWRNRSIDVVTARRETYARPGALPRVKPGLISDDLARRDFSINAMAIELHPKHFGDLLDPFDGQSDLKKRLVRVLHNKSFIDDATRIWRAIRYEQRLDFRIEDNTLRSLKRDLDKLDTISGTRIRRELEHVLREEYPEKPLQRADGLGVLAKLHPALKGDSWLEETFVLARERFTLEPTPPLLYLALLAYRLTAEEISQLVDHLKFPRQSARILEDTMDIKDITKEFTTPGMAPSKIYDLLQGHSLVALGACQLSTDNGIAAENIDLYLNVLRNIQPALSGKDLLRLGVPEGPRIKEVLLKLREARLDGRIDSSREEEKMVEAWLKKNF